MSTRSSVPDDIGEEGVADRSDSPVSGITTPSTGTSRRQNASTSLPAQQRTDVERIDDLPLGDLANEELAAVFSPLKRLMTAMEEEDQHDRRAYEDNPGAEDSEDEDGGANIALAGYEAAEERKLHEDEMAPDPINSAEADFAEYVEEFARGIRFEEEERLAADEIFDSGIPGAPLGWRPPCAPDNWNPTKQKKDKGEPNFSDVDNPGGWDKFVYRPTFAKRKRKVKKRHDNGDTETESEEEEADDEDVGKYIHHALPTGAVPVPADNNGDRKVKDYQFFYKGWTKQNTATELPFRSGATRENPFPEYRKSSLDGELLHKLGLNKMRMMEKDGAPDALFFHQLLLPIHDVGNKTVEGDPRKAYYPDVSSFMNGYAAFELKILSGYGHKYEPVEPSEVVRWDGSVIMDGVLGGSNGAFLRRFEQREGNTAYSDLIADAFTKTRWLELKRVHKLCNNLTAKPRGHDEYNPAYKYDFIYDVITHNVNALTLFAGLDLCGDETTFPFNGWGEAASGLFTLVNNKPGVTRGGQMVLISDVDRIRPRVYVHRHKLNPKWYGAPGANEVRILLDKLSYLCENAMAHRPRSIFREKPHITWDNYFSGDHTLQYACEQGFAMTMTTRRDRLPKGVPGRFLHKKKTQVTDRSKAARFEVPIFVVKNHARGMIQLTSFQSTSSCNFSHVNAINSLSLYAQPKERGRGEHKRRWGTEMNESRRLYLSTYGAIDRMDHLISNCHMHYRSWKYWHSPMIHAKAMAVVVAYDMYLECCEGKLQAGDWKVNKPVDFHRFREKLATQMLKYTPADRKYPGDEYFCVCTQQTRKKRRAPPNRSDTLSSGSIHTCASAASLLREDFLAKHVTNRLCGDLTVLCDHLKSIKALPNKQKKICVVCGRLAYHVCMKCKGPDGKAGVGMHPQPAKEGKGNPVACSIHHHNTAFFGLAKNDHDINDSVKRKRDWSFPSNETISAHASAVKQLLQPTEEALPGVSAGTATSGATDSSTAPSVNSRLPRRRILYENNNCV